MEFQLTGFLNVLWIFIGSVCKELLAGVYLTASLLSHTVPIHPSRIVQRTSSREFLRMFLSLHIYWPGADLGGASRQAIPITKPMLYIGPYKVQRESSGESLMTN
jgi:hypothetical protein